MVLFPLHPPGPLSMRPLSVGQLTSYLVAQDSGGGKWKLSGFLTPELSLLSHSIVQTSRNPPQIQREGEINGRNGRNCC